MTAIPGMRRRRTAVMLGLDLAALVLVAVLLFVGVLAIRDYTAATNAASDLALQRLPVTPTAMFATVDAEDQLTSVTMFVAAPGGQAGGSIVSIPVNADSTIGLGADRVSLQQVYADGGAEALVTSVESALRLTIDHWNVADPFDAGQFFVPIGPLEVDLPDDVRKSVDGKVKVVVPKGKRSLSAPQVAEVLNARVDSEPESTRRPNIEAVWSAVAAGIGGGLPGMSPVPVPASFDDVTATLFSGPVGARGLSASQFSPTENPTGIDVEQLDATEAVLVFASIAPASMSAPAPGLVFRIEAPPGYDAKVQETIGLVLFFGGNVSSVNLAGPLQPQTQMYVYDDRFKSDTEAFNSLLGTVSFPKPTVRVEGADVTLVLGTDYLNSAKTPVPASTTPKTDG